MLQQIQRVFEYSKLEFRLVWWAERLTDGKRFGAKRAGGAGLFGLIGRDRNQNGSDTHALDGPLNRDDRPMAERSTAGKDHHVRAQPGDLFRQSPTDIFLEFSQLGGQSHR